MMAWIFNQLKFRQLKIGHLFTSKKPPGQRNLFMLHVFNILSHQDCKNLTKITEKKFENLKFLQ